MSDAEKSAPAPKAAPVDPQRFVYRGPSQPVKIGKGSRYLTTGAVYADLPGDDPAVRRLIECRALRPTKEAVK